MLTAIPKKVLLHNGFLCTLFMALSDSFKCFHLYPIIWVDRWKGCCGKDPNVLISMVLNSCVLILFVVRWPSNGTLSLWFKWCCRNWGSMYDWCDCKLKCWKPCLWIVHPGSIVSELVISFWHTDELAKPSHEEPVYVSISHNDKCSLS